MSDSVQVEELVPPELAELNSVQRIEVKYPKPGEFRVELSSGSKLVETGKVKFGMEHGKRASVKPVKVTVEELRERVYSADWSPKEMLSMVRGSSEVAGDYILNHGGFDSVRALEVRVLAEKLNEIEVLGGESDEWLEWIPWLKAAGRPVAVCLANYSDTGIIARVGHGDVNLDLSLSANEELMTFGMFRDSGVGWVPWFMSGNITQFFERVLGFCQEHGLPLIAGDAMPSQRWRDEVRGYLVGQFEIVSEV